MPLLAKIAMLLYFIERELGGELLVGTGILAKLSWKKLVY